MKEALSLSPKSGENSPQIFTPRINTERQSISLCTLEEVARLKPSPTTTRTRSRTGRSTLPVGIFLERPIACHKNSTAIWFASGGGGAPISLRPRVQGNSCRLTCSTGSSGSALKQCIFSRIYKLIIIETSLITVP